jgi:uncharacterized protein (UPF0333 family)
MSLKNSQKGQIVVEYVLLLLVVVAIAAGIVKTVASRDTSDPGFLIEAWDRMLKTIGSDLSD